MEIAENYFQNNNNQVDWRSAGYQKGFSERRSYQHEFDNETANLKISQKHNWKH